MGNRIGLAFWVVMLVASGCNGLREAPDLTGGGGNGGNAGKGGKGGGVCTAGAPCTPTDACRVGTIACGASGPVCTATTQPQANGTVCGTNLVCQNGSCAACAAGTACTLTDKPCRVGMISCTTGAPVCTEANDQPNGTSCGAGMVCQAGQCTACQAGAACTPANNPCHVGTLSCTTGTPQCLDAETNVPAGTACGTNRVCNAAGTCGDCTVGTVCALAGKLCRYGTTTCNTGAPVCVESENIPNGTSCGTNMVCSSGACVACTAGLACTPTNPCHAGFTSCSPTITCADSGANLVNGTVCGTNKVCNMGICGGCTGGASCQPANLCRTGTTSCLTGTSACAETGNRPNGTSCGTNQVCNNGDCVVCTAGGACTPNNPCHVGVLSCSTGSSTCTDTGTLAADGKTCGTNMVCRTGSCVPCTANQTCSPTNPCKLGRTACTTGTSVCVESGNRPVGTLCGAGQSCSSGTLTAAAMCNGTQMCVSTTMSCPNGCNAGGTDCAACPTGHTMCPNGCRNLSTDPANCGGCGTACASPPVAGSGSAVCTSRACGVSCNAGYLECGNRSYCQDSNWGFEDNATGGFAIVGARGAVTSISTSTSVSHSGNSALAIAIDARRPTRSFEVGITLCDGGFLAAAGQSVSAWFYLSPDSANVPDPHQDSYVGLHLYTTTGDGGDGRSPLPTGTWFRVTLPISSVGARLESFSVDGQFAGDGTNDYDWSGVVYVDDITIQ